MFKGIRKTISSIFGRRVNKSDSAIKNKNPILRQVSEDVTIDPLTSQLYQLYTNAELSKEQVNEVLELKKMKESGTLSTIDCRAKVYKVISALSVEKAISVLNEI